MDVVCTGRAVVMAGLLWASQVAADVVQYEFQIEVSDAYYLGADVVTQSFLPVPGETAKGHLGFDADAAGTNLGPGVVNYPQAGYAAEMQINWPSGSRWEANAQAISVMVFDSDISSGMPDGVRFIADQQSLINVSSLAVDHIWITNAYPGDTFDSAQLLAEFPQPDPMNSAVSLRAYDASGLEFRIIGTITNFVPVQSSHDADGDGVDNDYDLCPETGEGELTDADGCAITQHCVCDGFKNHGQYVSCVARATKTFWVDGLISKAERNAWRKAAAKSACSK